MQKYVLFIAILLISSSFVPNKSLTFDIHFDKGESLLSDENYELLDRVVTTALSLETDYQISLEIFTTAAETLNRARVEEVLDYLKNTGVSVDKVLFYSDLNHVPVAVQKMESLDFLRLSIEYETTQIASEKVKNREKNNPKSTNEPITSSIIKNIQNEKIFTSISNFSDIKLKSKAGNTVELEPNSFVFEDGTIVTSSIEITIKDATTKDLAFFEGLETITSNGEILESQGMIYVNAKSNGKQLRLADGKSLKIGIKTDAPQEGFQVYNSEVTNGKITWFLAPETPKVIVKKIGHDLFEYKLEKLTSTELKGIEQQRQAIISKWESGGVPKKTIRKRLRSYRKNTRKRNAYKRKKRSEMSRRKDRKQPYISRTDILGETKYHYVKCGEKNAEKITYNIESRALGWINIDKPLRIPKRSSPCDLYVKTDRNAEVKVIFSDRFTIIDGTKTSEGVVFTGLSSNMRVTLVAAKKRVDGQVDYSYTKTTLDNKTIVLNKYTTASEKDFIRVVKRFAF